MVISRREWLKVATVGLGLTGCHGRRDRFSERVDAALTRGLQWLINAQGSDGSWRSRTYGALKDGLSLTAPVLKAVMFGPNVVGAERARKLGVNYLMSKVRSDGSIDYGPFGPIYPVYSAATAVLVLSRLGAEGAQACKAWRDDLRGRQLTEALGWSPADPAYGSWGYAPFPPSKRVVDSIAGAPTDADLSSTLFAVGSLRVAEGGDGDQTFLKALSFVERCQNFAEDPSAHHSTFDDGGFFLSPTDPARNKAGVAGTDHLGRERYYSYGGSTADGLRALMRCGLSLGHPRVQAARSWLERHFRATQNPGTFEAPRELERDATYFYSAWSVAHAFRLLGIASFPSRGRSVTWTEELATALIERQKPDGFWMNDWRASKEDDPLVATPLALGALGLCRMMAPLAA